MPELQKRYLSMKSENLSLKTNINELNLLKKQLLFNKTLESKDLLFLANRLIEKVPDPRNTKEHYQSFIRKKAENQ